MLRLLFVAAGAVVLFTAGSKKALAASHFDGLSFVDALSVPDSALQYLPDLARAEEINGLPAGMLTRVAYQESRFREDIITGDVTSSAGAQGLMQIVPRWHPDVNPLDPIASIYYAADYLRKLNAQFGTWELALAAYNWGPGNVGKRPKYDDWPRETQNYVTQISGDVRLV